MGYKHDAFKGISWITLLRVCTRGITFVRLAILGRILTPTQFGIFGIASLLLSLLEILTETGINVILVQHKGHIKEYVSSAWVVAVVRGVVLGLLLLVSAPYVASFFNAPDAAPVISLIAFVPFIRGFVNPAIITYQKDLLFHKEFVLRSLLFIIDVVVSISVGIFTKSAESFVWGLIASALVEVWLSYALLSVWPQLLFEYEKVKHIIKRGWWVTITGIFSYLADNGDTIVVGKLLGSSSLGIYQVAYKFSTLPVSEITNVVNQVVFPIYTKFSDDKDRLWKAFIKITTFSSIGAVILGGAIFLFAKSIILILMGDQWVLAIPVVQILAVYGILRTIFGNFAPLFLSVGKQEYVAKMTFFRAFSLIVCIVPFILSYGMMGAAYAMLLSIIIEIPILLYFTYKVFSFKK